SDPQRKAPPLPQRSSLPRAPDRYRPEPPTVATWTVSPHRDPASGCPLPPTPEESSPPRATAPRRSADRPSIAEQGPFAHPASLRTAHDPPRRRAPREADQPRLSTASQWPRR